eukprot:491450-Prymnesium_polylepis.1
MRNLLFFATFPTCTAPHPRVGLASGTVGMLIGNHITAYYVYLLGRSGALPCQMRHEVAAFYLNHTMVQWPWPMAYDAPCGGMADGRCCRQRRCRVSGATRALQCRGWHE